MSTAYTSSKLPADLQALATPMVDSDQLVAQRAGDNIMREVAASDVKAYAGGGGGSACNETMVFVAATWDSVNSQFVATVDWSAGCAFNIGVDPALADNPDFHNFFLLTHANLPSDVTPSSERTIIISYINLSTHDYFTLWGVADANGQPNLTIPDTNGGSFGVGVIKALCPGNLTTPDPIIPPAVATVAYTFAQAY